MILWTTLIKPSVWCGVHRFALFEKYFITNLQGCGNIFRTSWINAHCAWARKLLKLLIPSYYEKWVFDFHPIYRCRPAVLFLTQLGIKFTVTIKDEQGNVVHEFTKSDLSSRPYIFCLCGVTSRGYTPEWRLSDERYNVISLNAGEVICFITISERNVLSFLDCRQSIVNLIRRIIEDHPSPYKITGTYLDEFGNSIPLCDHRG